MEHFVDYIYEIGVMKRRRIAGFDHFISQQTSTLASHSHRAAIIGMILADLEGADITKVAVMLVLHETGEVRVGDTDMIAGHYRPKDSEHQAIEDQLGQLPTTLAVRLRAMYHEHEQQETLEAQVAKDADLLEHAFSAKEFVDQGIHGAQAWLQLDPYLHTESGKALLQALRERDSNAWWRRLNTM
jgi:putative hydrolases of HD superfamily